MTVEQLFGKYRRLQGELAHASAEGDWNQARVDRIANEIVRIERELAAQAPSGSRATASSAGEAPATAA